MRAICFFSPENAEAIPAALKRLQTEVDGYNSVLGIGESTLRALDKAVPGMRSFPAMTGIGVDIPSTSYGLMLWLRGDDRGELLHRTRELDQAVNEAFRLVDVIESFRYREGDDLTGYEDGTENPQGDDAVNAAIVTDKGNGLDGGSFVAVQQWLHQLDRFQSFSIAQQDDIIGRRISDNEELENAPDAAHVKRTAQENFAPPAFVLRRSMPWSASDGEGLMFSAFGKSFDAFEALLNRMVGNEDGIVDALFSFSAPVTGSYFWCPPAKDSRLELSALGIA